MSTSASTAPVTLQDLLDRLREARQASGQEAACVVPSHLADTLVRLLEVLASDRELRTEIMMVLGAKGITTTQTLELMERLADRAVSP